MSQSVARRWQRARRYLRENQFAAARVQLESMRSSDPSGAYTGLLGAQIAWHEGHPRDAVGPALEAAQVDIDDPGVLADVVETLLLVGETAAAYRLFRRPLWETVDDADMLICYAGLCQRFRRHEQALATLDRLLARSPDHAKWHCYRGQQLEFLGRLQEAESAYLACLELLPDHGYAAYCLVRLHEQHGGDGHIGLIEEGLRRAQPGSASYVDFEFARYHVLEDSRQDNAAWQALATANRLMYETVAAETKGQQAGLLRFCERCKTPARRVLTREPEKVCPIFIIGMPRSGTTLLERMLANHSQVASAGELTDFGRQLLRVANVGDLFDESFITRAATLDLDDLAHGYCAQTAWRAGSTRYLVDKQPANWLLVGLIHAALPHARILHLVRDPMDTCFSMWRARFASTHAWSYDVAALAARFRCYQGWMQHWHQTFAGAIMDVSYRQLVTEPAATMHDVLSFCGLPWEAGCEDLARNTGPVSTLSAAQVREPVHTRGLDRWRRYAAQLEPLRALLSPT